MNADGSGVTRLTAHPGLDLTPAWSPDGSRIAFASNRTGSFQIHAMNADGTAVRQLTSQGQHTDPAWSPDGRSIAFVRCCTPDGSSVIHVLSLATSQITTAAGRVWPLGGGPTWSPSSSTLAFVSTRDGNPDIYVVPATGGSATRLMLTSAADIQPAWSANGDIDFVSSRDGNLEVYARRIDPAVPGGVQIVRLTVDPAADTEPNPLSDGSRIALVSVRHGNPEIYALDLATRVVTRLTTNPGLDISPSWQPL